MYYKNFMVSWALLHISSLFFWLNAFDVDPTTQIDHSIVESFGGGGKAVIAARVYPTLAIDGKANLHVFNNGTENVKIASMSAWSMKKAQIG